MVERAILGVALVLVSLCALAPGAAPAVAGEDVYEQTRRTTPPAVATTDFGLSNCRVSQGCFAKRNLVFNDDLEPLAANLPDKFTFTFTLSPAQIDAVFAADGVGVLTVIASRDIGLRQKAGGGFEPATDWITATVDGLGFGAPGDLFRDLPTTCPPGETTARLDCGPNFHTDVQAIARLVFGAAAFRDAAVDGTIDVVLDPTDEVGRVKFFGVTLAYHVPLPSTLLLLVAGVALVGVTWRR